VGSLSFSKLFKIKYHLQAVFKPPDFLAWLWYKKGKKQRRKGDKRKSLRL
jgi:hypothetical protein